jgi:hypothetical protein
VWQSSQHRLEWQIGRGRHRTIPDGALIHKSTLDRIRQIDYSPPNFPGTLLKTIRDLPEPPPNYLAFTGDQANQGG